MKIKNMLVGISLMLGTTAFATPVSYDFEARLNFDPYWAANPAVQNPEYVGPTFDQNPFGSVHQGDVIRGNFIFDTDARKILEVPQQAFYTSGPDYGVYDPANIYTMAFNIGGSNFRSNNTEISVVNNQPDDRYTVMAGSFVPGASSFFSAQLQLSGGTGNLFDTTALLTTLPDLADIDNASFGLNYYIFVPSLNRYYQPSSMTATIVSLTPTPATVREPETAALILGSLALLGMNSRRRKLQ